MIVQCPFCGEDDFDRIGLKRHLVNGWCDIFNETDNPNHSRQVEAQGETAIQVATEPELSVKSPASTPMGSL